VTTAAQRVLVLTSPHLHGADVKAAQRLLASNRFKENYKPGKVDADYGQASADATKRAKFCVGYPKNKIDGSFGPRLHAFLLPKGRKDWKRLPPTYLYRRRQRAKQIQAQLNGTIKARALEIALAEAVKGVTENPPGSNDNPYGRWYGFNRVPWCCIYVTYCFVMAGDTKIFKRGSRSAYAYWPEQIAASHPLLRITSDPHPGDIVVYHHGQGHVEIFSRWINRKRGDFETVGGNTSAGGSQDNGGAVLVRQRNLKWARTVFVEVQE
jgi:hypothetical protein